MLVWLTCWPGSGSGRIVKPTVFEKYLFDQHPGPHGTDEKTLNA